MTASVVDDKLGFKMLAVDFGQELFGELVTCVSEQTDERTYPVDVTFFGLELIL